MNKDNMTKQENSKGFSLSQQPATSMRVELQDAVKRKEDYLLLKSTFASFAEGVEKKRQILARLNEWLETHDEEPKKRAVQLLIQETSEALRDDILVAKQLLTQHSGGCPATPSSSPVNDSVLKK